MFGRKYFVFWFKWTFLSLGLLFVLPCLLYGELGYKEEGNIFSIWNDEVKIITLANPKGVFGFKVYGNKGTKEVATIEISSKERWVAKNITGGKDGKNAYFELRGLDTSGTGGTPSFNKDSFIKVKIVDGNPYPEVEFSLIIDSFNPEKWEAIFSQKVPVYFIRCIFDEAKIIYMGGFLIPNFDVDQFPLSWTSPQARGPMRGLWSDGWSYAPAIDGFSVPSIGLWAPQQKQFVAYDFNHARLTDNSERFIAITYCRGLDEHPGQFVCLVYPYQKEWIELRYPKAGDKIGSHFNIIYNFDLPSWKDPNMFVLQRLWNSYQELLRQVPEMNNVEWMPERWAGRIVKKSEISKATIPPLLTSIMDRDEPLNPNDLAPIFIKKGTVMAWGAAVPYIDWIYQTNSTIAIEGLKKETEKLIEKAVWTRIDGEDCVAWNHPLEGTFKEPFGGTLVTTTHHISTFSIGATFLGLYKYNKDSSEYLRYVDGMFNWCRHFMWTRNGVCDLPWSMFCRVCLHAGEEFLMHYYHIFKDDPDSVRAKKAQEALEMARMVTYKNLWIYLTDEDPDDDVDPSFLLQAVNHRHWIGKVTWAETGFVVRMIALLYTETGDTFFKYCLRGILERAWMGYNNPNSFTENVEITNTEGRQFKGARDVNPGSLGCWMICSPYILPIKGTKMRVTAGKKAAIAFCKGTVKADIKNYAYESEGNCQFKIINKIGSPIDIIVTMPLRNISEKKIFINGEEIIGKRIEQNFQPPASDVIIGNLNDGDIVQIGEMKEAKQIETEQIKTRTLPKENLFSLRSFTCVNLLSYCDKGLEKEWKEPESWFGYLPGEHTFNGIPFYLIDPDLNNGKCAVEINRGIVIPVNRKAVGVFIFAGLPERVFRYLNKSSMGECRIRFADGTSEVLELAGKMDGLKLNDFPLKKWEICIYGYKIQNPRIIDKIEIAGYPLLFAISIKEEFSPEFSLVMNNLEQKMLENASVRRLHYYVSPAQAFRESWKWWNKSWPYRTLIVIDSGRYSRNNAIVKIKMDFTDLLKMLGVNDAFAHNSLRLVEYSSAGKIIGEVPVQFDPDTEYDANTRATGRLIWIMKGRTPENTKRYFYAYFGTEKDRLPSERKTGIKYEFKDKKVIAETGRGGLHFEFDCKGEGSSPRLMDLRFDLNGDGEFTAEESVLGPSSYHGMKAGLTAVQDRVTWYDFGTIQNEDATFSVLNSGSVSLTIKIGNLKIYGGGKNIEISRRGTDGKPVYAGEKGVADWYFQFYKGEKKIDQWIEYKMTDTNTKWTRDGLQVRFALNKWESTKNELFGGNPGAFGYSNELAGVVLDEEDEKKNVKIAFTNDGNVLEVSVAQPEGFMMHYWDSWRMMEGGLPDNSYIGEGVVLGITQYTPENVVKGVFITEGERKDYTIPPEAYKPTMFKKVIIDIGSDKPEEKKYLLEGWHGAEQGLFRWTGADGKDATIKFSVQKGFAQGIYISVFTNPPPSVFEKMLEKEGVYQVEYYANGIKIKTDNFRYQPAELNVQIPGEITQRCEEVTLRIRVPIWVPKEYDINPDTRQLGIAIGFIEITQVVEK